MICQLVREDIVHVRKIKVESQFVVNKGHVTSKIKLRLLLWKQRVLLHRVWARRGSALR